MVVLLAPISGLLDTLSVAAEYVAFLQRRGLPARSAHDAARQGCNHHSEEGSTGHGCRHWRPSGPYRVDPVLTSCFYHIITLA